MGSDSVSLQEVIQDLRGEGAGEWEWLGRAVGWGQGRPAALTMSGVVPIFLASSLRSMVLRYK